MRVTGHYMSIVLGTHRRIAIVSFPMKAILAHVFAVFLIFAEGIAQTPGAAEWSVSNLQTYPWAKIDGTNGAIVTDKSALVEVVGNVSSLNAAPTGARVPLPVIHLSGTAPSDHGPWNRLPSDWIAP